MRQEVDLSVVIPVFNEEKRVGRIKQVVKYLLEQDYSWEVVVIDDGSTDKTKDLVGEIQKEMEVILVSYPVNKGKGAAVKKGMLVASGKYRLFMDVDLSAPIEEVEKFIPLMGEYEVIIGTRKRDESEVEVRQSWLRETMGKGFTVLSRVVTGVEVSDFTCGFKCFSAQVAVEVFTKMTRDRWGFDVEILFLVNKLGYEIKEVPVKWVNDENSRVRFPEDVVRSLSDLWGVWWREKKGGYDENDL